jgi:hypothetical protein
MVNIDEIYSYQTGKKKSSGSYGINDGFGGIEFSISPSSKL